MAFVEPRVDDIVAHLEGVKLAVRAKRDEIAATAEALFAPHDHPGRHSIEKTNGRDTDAYVSLVGPAPLAVELGHWQRLANGSWDNLYVEGLHVLGRAVAAAHA